MGIKFCESPTWQEIDFVILIHNKVTIFYHTSYHFTHGNCDPAWEFSMYFNIEVIMRGYHAYESVWVALGKNCHAKGERANSENLLCENGLIFG